MPNHDGIAFDPALVDTTGVAGYNNRLTVLIHTKIEVPIVPLSASTDGTLRKIYIESVKDYLYGLPNSSIVMTVRFFQLVARDRFRQVENKPTAKPDVEDLVSWTAKHLGEDINTRAFQIMRNYVHTETLIEDADALEAIRHISKLANKLYPYTSVNHNSYCGRCRIYHTYTFNKADYYLGNALDIACPT
ncbi:MAG: hypothetical protein KGH64_06090, partial [Candidatus Micrarchaeota archaeon]|nr:hypothetical protein [Candidatus Micrarchaeota archaeon]